MACKNYLILSTLIKRKNGFFLHKKHFINFCLGPIFNFKINIFRLDKI